MLVNEWSSEGPEPLDQATLKKYLTYARNNVRPALHDVDTEKVRNRCKDYWQLSHSDRYRLLALPLLLYLVLDRLPVRRPTRPVRRHRRRAHSRPSHGVRNANV